MDFPFTTDGCSGGMSWAWRRLFGSPPPWEGLCVRHDRAYHAGGSKQDRAIADQVLMAGVTMQGHPVVGFLMWCAVRIGGHPLLPFPWRWGYGWKYPRRYS